MTSVPAMTDAEVVRESDRVRPCPVLGLRSEDLDRHSVLSGHHRRTDVEAVQGEGSGDLGQQARPVRGDHGDRRGIDGEGGYPVGADGVHDHLQLLGDQWGRRGDRLPREQAARPLDQIGHQPRLPRAPCGRAGCEAVRLDQRVQQVEQGAVADLVGHTLRGRRVVEVPPCRDVGQQEMESHHGHDRRHVVGG